MKKISLTLLVVMLCGMMVFAQGRPGKYGRKNITPKEHAERMTNRMAQELSLSDEQKDQVKDVNLAFCKQMQECRKNKKALNRVCCGKDTASLSDDARRSLAKVSRKEMRKLNEYAKSARLSRNAKLKEILTAEQYATLEERQAERKAPCVTDGRCPANKNGKRGNRP